jgi:hypothetical protein
VGDGTGAIEVASFDGSAAGVPDEHALASSSSVTTATQDLMPVARTTTSGGTSIPTRLDGTPILIDTHANSPGGGKQ